MDDAAYWGLVDLLGGRVDDQSIPRLEERLASLDPDGRGAFLDRTDELVEGLLAVCAVPESHQGDTAEWIAAAVIGAGRTTYAEVLAAAQPLDPAAWAWEDAEALLVAGFDDEDDGADGEAAGATDAPVALTWLARELPPGFEDFDEDRLLNVDIGLDEDDLAFGYQPFPDPVWTELWAELPPDGDEAAVLRTVSHVDLQVAVADVDELVLVTDEDGEPPTVRLKVPVAWVLAEESRADAYVKAVHSLLEVFAPED